MEQPKIVKDIHYVPRMRLKLYVLVSYLNPWYSNGLSHQYPLVPGAGCLHLVN